MDSPPDAESVGLLVKIIGAASAVIAPSWIGWNWLDKRFARKHQVADALQALTTEQVLHRSYFKDVFQQMRDMEKVSEARHRELMMHIMGRQDRK